MTVSYDLTTDVGKVRLNTFGDDTGNPIFQDEELQAFIDQEVHIKLACARVLMVVASRQAYILKVITNMGLSTNGAALAAEFRAQAKALRDEVKDEQAAQDAATDETGFDIAEMVVDQNTLEDVILNDIRRSSL
jgi:hypothetical protein